MKKYILKGTGLDSLEMVEAPLPRLTSDYDVIVEVKACSLNYRDLLVVRGLYGDGVYPPFVPLSDMSGVVREIGPKVTQFKVGDKVINSPFRYRPRTIVRPEWASTFIGATGVDGVLAHEIVYPEESLVKAPSHMSFEEASTLPIAGLTAWAALISQGGVKPGERVLIQGTGGVSLFALQIAEAVKAQTFLITTSEKKISFIKKHFPNTAVFLSTNPSWKEEVMKATDGCGVDLVVDVVGGSCLADCATLCAPGARIQVVGGLKEFSTTLSLFELIRRQIKLQGIFMESTEELRVCANAFQSMAITPLVDKVFTFDKAPEAYSYLASGQHIGKVVITR